MTNDSKTLGKVVQIDDHRIQDHLGELVRGTVEETLNGMLDAEADALCGAQRYERSPDRVDTRAGSYERGLHTKAGEVKLKVPKLRRQTFETAIIERYRRVLGVAEGHKEDKSGWSGFLSHLKQRGLKGVRLIISDACLGLVESVGDYYPEADWQRCMVHFYRNVFSHVPSTKVKQVALMLKAIHAQESLDAATEKADRIVQELQRMKLAKAAKLVEAAIHETLTFYRYPQTHWIRLRTNNPLERIMREIRRRTRVVGAFPDGNSALMLVAARLRHIAGTKWGTRRYLSMEALEKQSLEQQHSA